MGQPHLEEQGERAECRNYDPYPLDEELAQEALAYEPIEFGAISQLSEKHYQAVQELNKLYSQYIGEIYDGKKKGGTEGGRGPSDPCTETAKDCDLTRHGVAQGQNEVLSEEET